MKTIRRISAGSAFKVGAVIYALLFAIVFGLILLVQLLLGGLFAAAAGSNDAGTTLGLFAGFGIIGYFIGIIVYGLLGGIGSALAALIYNLVANMIGGLQIELE